MIKEIANGTQRAPAQSVELRQNEDDFKDQEGGLMKNDTHSAVVA